MDTNQGKDRLTMQNTTNLLFDNVISNIEDYAIILLDLHGNIKTWNKGAEKIKGYTSKEVLDRHFSMFFTQEDIDNQLPDKLLEEAAKSGRTEHEGWRVGKYDDRFWASVVITRLDDERGNAIGYIKITHDLSERVAAERIISEYEQTLSEQAGNTKKLMHMYQSFITEVEGYAIIMLNKDGMIIDWNKGAEKIKGYASEDIIGRHFSIFYTAHDKNIMLPETLLQKAATYGRVVSEGWRIKKDGSKFWANTIITAIRNDITGELIGFAKITQDLTAKIQRELDAKQETAT